MKLSLSSSENKNVYDYELVKYLQIPKVGQRSSRIVQKFQNRIPLLKLNILKHIMSMCMVFHICLQTLNTYHWVNMSTRYAVTR